MKQSINQNWSRWSRSIWENRIISFNTWKKINAVAFHYQQSNSALSIMNGFLTTRLYALNIYWVSGSIQTSSGSRKYDSWLNIVEKLQDDSIVSGSSFVVPRIRLDQNWFFFFSFLSYLGCFSDLIDFKSVYTFLWGIISSPPFPETPHHKLIAISMPNV